MNVSTLDSVVMAKRLKKEAGQTSHQTISHSKWIPSKVVDDDPAGGTSDFAGSTLCHGLRPWHPHDRRSPLPTPQPNPASTDLFPADVTRKSALMVHRRPGARLKNTTPPKTIAILAVALPVLCAADCRADSRTFVARNPQPEPHRDVDSVAKSDVLDPLWLGLVTFPGNIRGNGWL